MNQALVELVRIAGKIKMTETEREEQRVRFSYGSAKIENDRVTEDMVRQASEMSKSDKKVDG
jgi:hypothetical protein